MLNKLQLQLKLADSIHISGGVNRMQFCIYFQL